MESKRRVQIPPFLVLGVLQCVLASAAFAQAPTRELDSPLRGERHAENFTAHFPLNSSQAIHTITPVVPAGKKLVLQSASFHTILSDSQSPTDTVVTIVQGRARLAVLHVDMDFQGALPFGSRQRHFTGNRDINMVVNAGESIQVTFARNSGAGDPSWNFSIGTLIGYFVDVDPQTPAQ